MGFILGIDEAGRGALCGPMVIAGALIDEAQEAKLKAIGVKDSKLLSPAQRARIRKELEGLVEYAVIEVTPQQIDENNMNHLELDSFAQIIKRFGTCKVFVDAMEADEEGVRLDILKRVGHPVDIVSKNKADSTYLIVGAASIIAKTSRDARIDELKARYGDFGSGYPADPRTKAFIEDWVEKNRFIPSFVRKKWSTLDNLRQRKLLEF